MSLPKSLMAFFNEQKARYGELFWYQIDGNKIILMIEKLAEKAREILNYEGDNDLKVVSFEIDDSIGDFYSVEAEQIDLETKPSKQEYQSITDSETGIVPEKQINDVSQNQLIRVYQPRRNMVGAPTESSEPSGYQSFCAVVYHSFGTQTPRQIGWIKDLNGLKRLTSSRVDESLKPKTEPTVSFEEACKQLDGVKYQIGGGSMKNGFDCSSLAQRIFYQTKGIWLPRKARWQAMVCWPVQLRDLQQGDLAFFNKVEDMKKQTDTSIKFSVNGERSQTIDHVALVFEVQPSRLPVIFHAKKLNGKAEIEDLNIASWLNLPAYSGGWEISGFGRVKS